MAEMTKRPQRWWLQLQLQSVAAGMLCSALVAGLIALAVRLEILNDSLAVRLSMVLFGSLAGVLAAAAYTYLKNRGIVPYLQRWLTWLDNPPDWATGHRRVRVYLDTQQAITDGFTEEALAAWPREYGVYTVILQQGRLDLWLRLPRSTDPPSRLSPETL